MSEIINTVEVTDKQLKKGENRYTIDVANSDNEIAEFWNENMVGEFVIHLEDKPFEVF